MDFFMKVLIPRGEGAFYVHRFVAETEADKENVRNELMSESWADATQAEYDNFLSAAPAVGGVILGKEYVCIDGLSDEEKREIRAKVHGA